MVNRNAPSIQDGLSTTVRNFLSQEDLDLIEKVAVLSREEFLPRASHYDREGIAPKDDYAALHEAGLLGLTIPKEYGGLGASPLCYTLCIAEMARGDMSTALSINMHYVILWLLDAIASEEQKRRYFKEVIDDGSIIATCASELGVDWQNAILHTLLIPENQGHYRVRGTKAFCSLSNSASLLFVHCRADGYTSTKKGYILAMVNSDNPGVTILDDWKGALGLEPTESNSIQFDCLIPQEDVIGALGQLPESGKLALFTLGYAAVSYGAARAVFDLLHDYLKRPDKRTDTAIQKIMGEMATKIQSVHLLLVDAALECAKGVGLANTQA